MDFHAYPPRAIERVSSGAHPVSMRQVGSDVLVPFGDSPHQAPPHFTDDVFGGEVPRQPPNARSPRGAQRPRQQQQLQQQPAHPSQRPATVSSPSSRRSIRGETTMDPFVAPMVSPPFTPPHTSTSDVFAPTRDPFAAPLVAPPFTPPHTSTSDLFAPLAPPINPPPPPLPPRDSPFPFRVTAASPRGDPFDFFPGGSPLIPPPSSAVVDRPPPTGAGGGQGEDIPRRGGALSMIITGDDLCWSPEDFPPSTSASTSVPSAVSTATTAAPVATASVPPPLHISLPRKRKESSPRWNGGRRENLSGSPRAPQSERRGGVMSAGASGSGSRTTQSSEVVAENRGPPSPHRSRDEESQRGLDVILPPPPLPASGFGSPRMTHRSPLSSSTTPPPPPSSAGLATQQSPVRVHGSSQGLPVLLPLTFGSTPPAPGLVPPQEQPLSPVDVRAALSEIDFVYDPLPEEMARRVGSAFSVLLNRDLQSASAVTSSGSAGLFARLEGGGRVGAEKGEAKASLSEVVDSELNIKVKEMSKMLAAMKAEMEALLDALDHSENERRAALQEAQKWRAAYEKATGASRR